jgi:hypothetical protein
VIKPEVPGPSVRRAGLRPVLMFAEDRNKDSNTSTTSRVYTISCRVSLRLWSVPLADVFKLRQATNAGRREVVLAQKAITVVRKFHRQVGSGPLVVSIWPRYPQVPVRAVCRARDSMLPPQRVYLGR